MKYLDDLASRRRFGIRPGLEAIRGVCAALDDPQSGFPAIHVAGTNGKGAVCALTDAALRAAGFRVGRYTSPHLVRINERFFLDGAPVGDDVLERLSERVGRSLNPQPSAHNPDLTFFEALTAVAFALYAEAKVDYAVLECGLGGRLDATNVCRPALCVITKVGLDHCDWLGDTVEKIAAEKAGIVKPGVPVVLGRNDAAVRSVVEARAHEVGAPFHYAPDLADERELPPDLSLPGAFNRENAVTALAALKILFGESRDCREPVRRGFAEAIWPGRFQRVGNFIVDGAHNPPAAAALRESLSDAGLRQVDLIAGFCGDKDVDKVLSVLAPAVRRGLAVRTNNPRSLSAEATAKKMRASAIDAFVCDSLADALKRAGQSDLPTLVCGSLFLAGEALTELGAFPWANGRFDPAESASRC